MKILQINASYKPAFIYGGPTMSVSMLCEQLVKAGHEVEVYTTAANGAFELDVPVGEPMNVDGVKVTYFKRITKDHTHYSPALLGAVKKTAKLFDVVHIHAWWNLPSMFSCYRALKAGVPVILSPRGTLSSYSFHHKNGLLKSLFHRWFAKRLIEKCTIHATSTLEADAMRELSTAEKIVTVPNFVKILIDAPRKTTYNGGILKLLFFSRIDKKKRLDLLLKSLPDVECQWTLTIAGSGEYRHIEELKQISTANNTSAKINWIGFQGENKFETMAAHDVLILPSHDENFANVIIESLSVGTAVIASKTVGLADYVERNNFGLKCDADISSISKSIDALHNADRLNQIAATAPGIIRADFGEEKLIAQYEAMYQAAIKIPKN